MLEAQDVPQSEILEKRINQLPSNSLLSLELTDREIKYLQEKQKLKICIDPNWMPIEKLENGVYIGIAADMMERISKIIETPFEIVPTKTWQETLQKAKKRECDIVALAQKTPEREKYLDFTSAYLQTPLVIATKSRIPFIDSLEKIKHEKLAIVKNYSMKELLHNSYEVINLIEVGSIQEGIAKVHSGDVFGFLDNPIVINYELLQLKAKDISISGQFQESFDMSIASRNDEPILHEILQKALDTIDVQEREQIKNRWQNIVFEVKANYDMAITIFIFSMILVSLLVYWNIKLKKEIRKKEKIKEALRQSEIRFRTLFDIAPVMINAFDKENNIILWNKECAKVFGWSLEDLKNAEKPISYFYPDPKDQETLISRLMDKDDVFYREWQPFTKSGEKVVTMWANVHMEDGQVIHVGYDITKERKIALKLKEKAKELKISQKELQLLNASLQERIDKELERNTKQHMILSQKNKLAQMGEMIENIAHQWRQPLAQINSLVLLLDMTLEQEKIKTSSLDSILNEIESLTEYMSKTINDFKDFFNPDKEAKDFMLYEAIVNVLFIVQGSFNREHINIMVSVPKETLWHGYRQELEQVIVTLLNNAKDAIVKNNSEEKWVKISLYQNDESYTICIEDNAGGIPEELICKIFEPYFTTKEKTQGTGLGLYMANMITSEGLGGEIRVANKEEGACFEIDLPKRKSNG